MKGNQMGTDEKKELILAVLRDKGAMGVSTLAKEVGLPVSTIHRYLHDQNYFKLNERRRWDLPERVQTETNGNTLTLMVSGLENAILFLKAQLEEVRNSVDGLLVPTNTLKKGITNFSIEPALPVAIPSKRAIPERIETLLETLDNLPKIIRSRKDFVKPETYEMLRKVEWLDLMLDYGKKALDDIINPELQDVLLGNQEEFSEDVLGILKEYLK
jgi:hypothetical protein